MEKLVRWRNMKNADHKSPLRKVIKVYQNVYGDLIEVLECGHEFIVREPKWWREAVRRRCKACRNGQNLT